MKIKLPTIGVVSALFIIAIAFLMRFHERLLMPKSTEVLILGFIVSFLFFAAAIWNESPMDERENILRLNANRIAFLAGCTYCVIGIIQQTSEQNVDIWLIGVLIVMVTGKLISLIISQWRD
ncbi:hypothetical protein A2801_01050 [Candidatus Woesebacteria bacterium RIFCSPHIGHO2_01_FULL_41_10]|uniref:Uncharacterized protein n=1 Tax=Candidatus Woesebacteria bacterium RIFCSPHIGHO2_01_FULL_41_10 TaxID=1802500 RepID=A0A1F7YNN3_9BACT|nr:MAG: hypothetical protein A2801_01050 [Candidatus Woesebacteria bacterium RIFCSPHIGHO2_01_FULL_41_10]